MEIKNLQKIDEIKMRLLQFAKEQKLIMGDFYEKISLAPSNFSGKAMYSSLKSENIVTVLKVYPELSADWLLLGKGEMLRKNNGKSVNVIESPQTNISNGNITIEAPAELITLISSQQETIRKLTDIISKSK
jgi:hypothetical protein